MSGKKAKPKRYERGYHPPSYYVWQGKHPRVVIYLTPEIKTQIDEIVEREKREQSKKTSRSKWCSEIVMSAFDENRRREILSDAIIHELTKEARATADKYRDEKKREGDEYYNEITSEADEHHGHVVEFQDSYVQKGYDRGMEEGLKRGESRGRSKTEREFEGRLREAEEGREEAEEAAGEAARKGEYEKGKKKYNLIIDENTKGFKLILKEQEKKFERKLAEERESFEEEFDAQRSELTEEYKKKMKEEYKRGDLDGYKQAKDYYFNLGHNAGLKDRGFFGIRRKE